MKTFKEFCKDANIQEFWNPFVAKPKPKPSVLAYKDYKPGVLNKDTGKFTPRPHTSKEQQRYGWKPVETTVYTPGDRFTPNKVTATGDPHNWTTRNAAVPFKYKKHEAPKGKKGEPSIPYGSSLKLTNAPMGLNTKTTTAKINDVGNFGKTGDVNKYTEFDLSPQITRDLIPGIEPIVWGKRMVYSKVIPQKSNKK